MILEWIKKLKLVLCDETKRREAESLQLYSEIYDERAQWPKLNDASLK